MLTPDYYEKCTDDIIELFSQLNERITKDMARRIIKSGKLTETAKWQLGIEREAGRLYDEILADISKYTGESKKTVQDIFEKAGITSKEYDDAIYKQAGKNPIPLNLSPSMMQILKADIDKTNGHITNLTKTTALTSQTAYIDACSIAQMEISSGAFDYNTAIRHAVDMAVSKGSIVKFASGATMNLEDAIRRAVMTGVSQTTGRISLANAEELGADLMEINAHGGARPEHAVWQGKIVCIKGKKKGYLTLDDIGYGTVTGFKGVNCRHDWYPFIEGISTRAHSDAALEKMNQTEVEYNGKKIPQYTAEQMQRQKERQIRNERRILAGYDEAIKAADNTELKIGLQNDFDNRALMLKEHERKYKDFCKQTNLPELKERLQTKGYNRSVSAKVVARDKKAAKFDELSGIITSTGIKVGGKDSISTHLRSRAIERSISADDIKNALTSPLTKGKIRTDNSQQFVGEKATAVINTKTGKLITTWPTSSSRAKSLKERSKKE